MCETHEYVHWSRENWEFCIGNKCHLLEHVWYDCLWAALSSLVHCGKYFHIHWVSDTYDSGYLQMIAPGRPDHKFCCCLELCPGLLLLGLRGMAAHCVLSKSLFQVSDLLFAGTTIPDHICNQPVWQSCVVLEKCNPIQMIPFFFCCIDFSHTTDVISKCRWKMLTVIFLG